MDDDYSDEVMNRLWAINEPLRNKATAKLLAYERKMDERFAATLPANHPFEYDPKRPTLHP